MAWTDRSDLENRFTYHKPFGSQPKRYESIRAKAKELAILITELTPHSREQSLALTKLEECSFWANASIARNEIVTDIAKVQEKSDPEPTHPPSPYELARRMLNEIVGTETTSDSATRLRWQSRQRLSVSTAGPLIPTR